MSDAPEDQGSTDAIHRPIIKRTRRETHTGDLPIGQKPVIDLDDYQRGDEVIIPVSAGTDMEYVAELAFNEEPMTIRIERSSEKFSPKVVDCWVQGRGAELFVNGKWMVCGWLPVGQPIITRRKYVEVLARAKPDAVTTEVIRKDESEENNLVRYTSSKYPFSVIRDDNPRGYSWLVQVLAEN